MPPGAGSQQMQGQPQMLPPMGASSQPPGFGVPVAAIQTVPGAPLGMPGQYDPYGQSPYAMGQAPPLDAGLPPEGRRRSSIVRDVAIGVVIAAVVLGGFLAVKFLILDSSDEEPAARPLADLQVSMPGIEHADLYIDNNRHASVSDNAKVQVPAGPHEVKLVGPGNQQCKKDITLVAGQVTAIECNMAIGAGGGSGDPGAGSAGAGSAGTGSAAPSSAGSGSTAGGSAGGAGVQVATDDKSGEKTVDHPDTSAADKAAAEKAAAEKAAADKAAADKAAADKAKLAAADKAAADKAAADKAAADKAKLLAERNKNKGEDNPADRAGTAPSKGWVQLTSKPSAKILVDGNDTNLSTPITGRALSLPAGRHRVTFQIGGDKYTFTVQVKAGETVTLDKNLQ